MSNIISNNIIKNNKLLYCKYTNCKICNFWKINKLHYKTNIFSSLHCYICHFVSFIEESKYQYEIYNDKNKKMLLCYKCVEYINNFKKYILLNHDIIFIIIKYIYLDADFI